MKPSHTLWSIAIAAAALLSYPITAGRAFGDTPSPVSSSVVTGPVKGNLVIVGGGLVGPEIWQKFIELAGGKDAKFVVIPTAGEGSVPTNEVPHSNTPDALKALGVTHITILHTRDPKEANTESFTAPIRAANAVWFDGGRQWHLADSYLNTRTQTELFALLDRGGVIGGSSAGATIQGSYMVRGDTKGAEIVEGDHTVAFGFLKNAAIDQHILVRNRQFDLIPLIEKHPELLGIGINESTAIVVHGTRFDVIGKSHVAITDAGQWSATGVSSPNDAAHKGKIYFLASGQSFDLATRKLIQATRRNTASARQRRTADISSGTAVP